MGSYMAEPKALIGFTGPRAIRETIKQELPDGFQTSEFCIRHGQLDLIVTRRTCVRKSHAFYRTSMPDASGSRMLDDRRKMMNRWCTVRCVRFDVDSTVSPNEGIDVLAAFAGKGD